MLLQVVTIIGLVGYHWAKEPDAAEEDATDKDEVGAYNASATCRLGTTFPPPL